MSNNIVEITENPNYSITVDTSLVQNDNNVIIELANSNNVDIINNTTVLVSDLPQGYPLGWTTENLPINRVSGLVGISGINYADGIISLGGLPLELLPVQNLTAGSGINIINNNGVFTVAVTGQFGLTGEQVDDRVNTLLQPGTNIVLNYNDDSNILTISTSGLQQSGNYSLVGHDHVIADVSGLQNVLDNKQPSGVYASGVHYHVHSDITDFNNSVDSRIIAANLQPSGNYSIVGHSHLVSDVSGLQNILDSKQASGNYTPLIHNHSYLDITDFNSGVSGLLPSVSGSGYINSSFDNNIHLISVIGLQPSGNYSIVGHHHISSDIDDLVSTITGVSPVKSVSGRIGDILLNKNDVGLNNVDNTSDTNKPVSIAQALADSAVQNAAASDASIKANNAQAYSIQRDNHTGTQLSNTISDFNSSVSGLINGIYAPLNNPNFSGIPTVPTASSGTNNTQIANTQFVRSEISNLVNSAPSTLDTLNELATALGNDPNFATTIASGLASKSNIGHSHNSSDITNFNSSVSGLLPVKNVIASGSYINVSSSAGTFIVQVTGVQPSGSYPSWNIIPLNSGLPVITTSNGNIINGSFGSTSGTFCQGNDQRLSDSRVPLPHTHTSSNITDFNSSVSGLLPSITGSSYINTSFTNNIYTIGISGLQPSGNYSLFGHTHTVNDISNFNSSVSGLLPSINGSGYIKSIFNNTNNTYTIYSSGLTTSDITNFSSGINDNLTTTLLPGNFINLTYDSTLDTLTISTSGLQPSGNYSVVGHSHVVSDITNFASGVSGLLPTISNSGNNRLLTSNGTTTGVSAQNNLTFNGSLLSVYGSGTFSSGLNLNNQTSNTIASFDSNKNLISLSTGTYPTLNELSYIKGLTSSVQTQLDNKQVSGNYSIVGHSHISSNITDFNSSVSGLINGIYAPLNSPSLTGVPLAPTASSGTNTDQIASTKFVRTEISNLVSSAPSTLDTLNELANALGNDPNFATTVTNNLANKANLSGATFSGAINGPGGDFTILKQNGAIVSVSGHQHVANDITNFNTSVSGLLPITNILAGSNIGVSSSGSVFTVAVTGQLGLTTEEVDDRVATLLVAGTGIDLTYNDASNILVITSVGSSPSGNYALAGHTHVAANITDFSSAVSGLLPTINNSGDNRILTSTGGAVEIYAENNLTFDGSLLTSPSGSFTNLKVNDNNVIVEGDIRLTDNRIPTDGSVTTIKIADSAVSVSKILASGAASSGTFLRGDGLWSTPTASVSPATTTTLGGVIVPTSGGLLVDSNGNISQSTATTSDAIRMSDSLKVLTVLRSCESQEAKWPLGSSGWTSATGNGGQINLAGGVSNMNSGSTANGYAILRASAGGYLHWSSAGTAGWIRFSTPKRLHSRWRRMQGSTNGIFRIQFGGKDNNSTTIGRLTDRGFGLEVRNLRVWIIAHNGSSLTQTDTGFSISSSQDYVYDSLLTSDGAGNIALWLNGTQVGTSTGGPSTDLAAAGQPWGMTIELTNGGDSSSNIYYWTSTILLSGTI